MTDNFPCKSLICYEPPKSKVRIGRQNDGGYVIIDGYYYDLMLGCGISDDSSFEHAFLQKSQFTLLMELLNHFQIHILK